MRINGNSWHVRVYKWWYENKYRDPADKYAFPAPPKTHSNLCPYMRAVMFWAPLRAIFGSWIKIGKIPVNAITLPAVFVSLPFLLGYASYNAKMACFFSYGVFTFIGLALTFVWLVSEKKIFSPVEKAIDESSFYQLLKKYQRSAHDRVCPEISWE